MLDNFESLAIIHVPNRKGLAGTQINLIIFKKFQIYQKKIKIGKNLANILFCLITIRLHYIWKSLLNAGLFFLKYK